MKSVRSLLSLGNQKLGESIHVWSIPATDEVCVGATEKCKIACYARKSRFLLPQVKERLEWNLDQARLDSFVPRMVQEVKRRGCLVIRVHTSGDFLSREYADKWLQVMRQCPKPRFYWYSRSWRVPEIAEVLEQMAALKCCRAWYSVDSAGRTHLEGVTGLGFGRTPAAVEAPPCRSRTCPSPGTSLTYLTPESTGRRSTRSATSW